ncbi:glycosyl hydrolase family 8 [Helicovermis profundi]|uniref:Uncharacterized protein n=1 Tax=Helicovermis profundi TaxID=3065157 RepID=A0AAU9E5D1_9FIRM|nr:hypothetical protein HLPR_01180 [Clostridia bacterium S502]
MFKKRLFFILILFILLISGSIIAFCYFSKEVIQDKNGDFKEKNVNNNILVVAKKNTNLYINKNYIYNEKLCFSFLDSKMSKKFGVIYTNYLSNKKTLSHSTGHEILSESIGLIMLYAVHTNNNLLFDSAYDYMIKNLFSNDIGILWRSEMSDNSVASSNASIDDLRILRALIEAKSLFDTDKYNTSIKRINDLTLSNLTYKNNLISYYSKNQVTSTNTIEIGYIDLFTIKLLINFDSRWKNVYKTSIKIVNSSKLKNIPLFYKSYNIKNKTYKINNKVNMLDSLITMLHLSEVDLLDDKSYNWLKNKFYKEGKLYGSYFLDGEPTYNYESSAVYAIAARLADSQNDDIFYNDLLKKLVNLQVTNSQSEIFGSFGNIDNLEVYSYDNLQSLLAFRRKNYEATHN